MAYKKIGEKEIKNKWPVEEGTTSGTTKQTIKKYSHATDGSNVPRSNKVGIGD